MTPPEAAAGFTVKLTNFEGPFDLLLQLISRHKLDVTEVALSAVTDEFIAHLRALGSDWDLDQTSSFLVVAATLLDLKAARLLPAGEVEDAEDIAMLEARDLLFARLLQYRAFKQVSTLFRGRLEAEATLLPEVVLTVDGEQLAWLAARALQPKPEDAISLAHLHAPAVSVREQAHLIVTRVREAGSVTFRALVADAGDRLVVVARFLALLELARQRAVAFDQLAPLGELTVRWTASDAAGYEASHIDEFTGVPPQGEHHE